VLENGTNPVQECIYTVFEEEFWHNRYAQRDLAQLEAATQDPPRASPQHAGEGTGRAEGRTTISVGWVGA
jgi:hypothetical protein